MKKMAYLVAVIFVFILFVTACTTHEINYSVSAVTSGQNGNSSINTPLDHKKSEIDVQSPMTLSNSICTYNGKPAYLRLKMVKGRYYEDWNPGAYMGTLWEGSFVIELADECGKTIKETDISKMFSEPLTFKFSFNLEFDDYNNDGDLDFTIGQYASSNGRLYKILTLRKDGSVEELPVKDHPDLFISNTTGYYSTKLNKINGTSFEIEYYDNTAGTFHDSYKWDGTQFVLLKSQKPNAAGSFKNNEGQTDSPVSTNPVSTNPVSTNLVSAYTDDTFDLLSVKINGKTVTPNSGLINEHGFNLEAFCRDVYPGMKLQIIEYSKKTYGGYKGSKIPIRFKISSGKKSVEFEGVDYASPVNGEPVAEYIAGKFGEIRARYKNGLYLGTNESVGHFLDSMGIGYTFYDEKSIDLHN